MLLNLHAPVAQNVPAQSRYTHSFVASFPTILQKLSKGYSAVSISTLCHYSALSRFRIKLGSTRNTHSQKKRPVVCISFIRPSPIACYSLFPTPSSSSLLSLI